MLQEIAPASDNEELLRWQIAALECAIRQLSRPRFELNPFV